MTTTRVALDEFVELRARGSVTEVDDTTRRRALLGGLPKSGVLAAAGLGTAMAALIASPAFADKTMDVQMLQTAASIENLAVATYDTALTLDFIGGASANPVVKAFVQKTKEQHQQHARGVQRRRDPARRQVAGPARPGAARRREQRQAGAHRAGRGRRPRHRARRRRGADVRGEHRDVLEQERPHRWPPASWASRRSTSRSSTR